MPPEYDPFPGKTKPRSLDPIKVTRNPREIEQRTQKTDAELEDSSSKYLQQLPYYPTPDYEDPDEAPIYPRRQPRSAKARQLRRMRLQATEEAMRRLPQEGPLDLHDLLWKGFQGREWVWEKFAATKMGNEIEGELKSVKAELELAKAHVEQDVQTIADKQVPIQFGDLLNLNAVDVGHFVAELALELPVLKQVVGLASLVFKGGMTAKTLIARAEARQLAQRFEKAELTALGARSLALVLGEKLNKQVITLGASTLDQLVGFLDPTAIASTVVGIAASVFKLIYKIRILARTRVQMKAINAVLAGGNPKAFNLELFAEMPLLGCYVFEDLNVGLSAYLGYTTPYVKRVGEVKLGGVSNILGRDFVHMQNVVEFEALRKQARSRRRAAPVILLTQNRQIPEDLGLKDRIIAKLL